MRILLLILAVTGAALAQERPHIVIFLADDLGWRDVGYHGSEIKTPHLDALAASGARLDQFYVQPVCSPTRSALMTGRYPIRQGLQVGVIRPWARYGLPLSERTLAQALQQAGYFTAITGKWHLGLHAPEYLPTRRGFDHQYGHYCGALDYYTHQRDGGHDWHRGDTVLHEKGYTTQLVAAEAVRLVSKHDLEKPLFLYVPFNAPHTPLQAPPEYRKRYDHIAKKRRRAFAAMVTCLDDAVGAILKALDERGMRKNTLVFFSSDNGGARAAADNGPLRGRKGTLYEGGVRVPALMAWPRKIRPGTVVRGPLHIVDLFPTLVKLAGGSLKQAAPLDGLDVWAAVAKGAPSPRKEILHNVEPRRGALRMGDWKLVTRGARRELFNIAEDPYERKDLAREQPERVQKMLARLNRYAQEAAAPRNRRRARPKSFKVPKVWGQEDG